MGTLTTGKAGLAANENLFIKTPAPNNVVLPINCLLFILLNR
jgi:hypothetical protein